MAYQKESAKRNLSWIIYKLGEAFESYSLRGMNKKSPQRHENTKFTPKISL